MFLRLTSTAASDGALSTPGRNHAILLIYLQLYTVLIVKKARNKFSLNLRSWSQPVELRLAPCNTQTNLSLAA
jgi:hypothetical protein